MKTALSLIVVFLSIITLPFTLVSSYLLYRHVQATELMWFLWWMTLPFTILVQVLSQIAARLLKDE